MGISTHNAAEFVMTLADKNLRNVLLTKPGIAKCWNIYLKMGEGLTDLKKELEVEKTSKDDLNREFNECKVKCAALEKELSEYKSEVNKYNLN